MAGGPLAAVVPCFTCGARAERTGEGLEDDLYLCANGHRFGVDWSVEGPPQEPQWPPPPGFQTLAEQLEALARRKA